MPLDTKVTMSSAIFVKLRPKGSAGEITVTVESGDPVEAKRTMDRIIRELKRAEVVY